MPCDYPAGAAFNAEPPNLYPALFGVTMVGGGVLSQYRYASVFKQDDAAFFFFRLGCVQCWPCAGVLVKISLTTSGRMLLSWGWFSAASHITGCECRHETLTHVVNAFYAGRRQQPAECWLKHRKPRANSEDYVWKPYSCGYDLMNAGARQRCFEQKGVRTFLEYGDRSAQF